MVLILVALAGCRKEQPTAPTHAAARLTATVPTPATGRPVIGPTAATGATAGPAASTRGPVGPQGDLLVVGDSLTVGTQTVLPGLLPGWTIRSDARPGRELAEGMAVLRDAVSRRRPDVAVVALFTNDIPTVSSQLTTEVRSAAQLADCSVWLTIVRPPVDGVSYDVANVALTRLASAHIRIVDWAGAVAAHPSYLLADGIHGTPEGYAARAQLVADAVRSCPRG